MATTVTLKPNAIDLSGSTSGTTTLQASAVAGTTTVTLPAATDTLVGKATTDTLTNKTLTSPTMTAPVLGTPASGTVTNLTGTASININGTVGATTPAAGSFTTLSATGDITAGARLLMPGAAASLSSGSIGLQDGAGIFSKYNGGTSPLKIAGYTSNVLYIGEPGYALTIQSSSISATGIVTPGTFTTGTRPTKTLGGIIFDTTLNKLCIGGASAWEVVTSV